MGHGDLVGIILGGLGLGVTVIGWAMRTWLRSELGPMRERLVALETRIEAMNHVISNNIERVIRDLWRERESGGRGGWGGDGS